MLKTLVGTVVVCTALSVVWQRQPGQKAPETWSAYQMSELLKKRAESNRSYLPFLNVSTLHCGVYALKKGATDGQSPHGQDEVYYAIKGVAKFKVGKGEAARDIEVKPGSVIFVAAGEEHRFHSIEEDLELLVFFSKAKPK